jgi:hypothetical protein
MNTGGLGIVSLFNAWSTRATGVKMGHSSGLSVDTKCSSKLMDRMGLSRAEVAGFELNIGEGVQSEG